MKRLVVFVLCMFVLCTAWGQGVDSSLLDLTKAKVSLAGPDRLYVTHIGYGGTRIAVILQYDKKLGARIIGPISAKDQLLPDATKLKATRLGITDSGLLVISNVQLYGNSYSGKLYYDGRNKLTLISMRTGITPVSMQKPKLKASSVKGMLINPALVDLTNAELSLAGPDQLYLRKVKYGVLIV